MHPDPNIIYLTKKEFSNAILTVTNQLTLYLTLLDKQPKNIKILSIKEWKKDDKLKRIGINANSLTLTQLNKLKEMYPQAKFIDISKEINKKRQIKTLEEIKLLKKAAKITDLVFEKIVNNFNFETELDIKQFIEKEIISNGATLAFPPIVATAKNSKIPHHQTSTTKLKKGFLLMDFGARYKGYCSDMTRMIYLGSPTKGELENYNLLLKVQQKAILSLKENKFLKEVEKEVRINLKDKAKYFTHSLGHGVGIDIHETPNVKTDKIQNNQIFTIEPGIYLKNYGLRIEDTLLFQNKPIILTKSKKELIIIPF